MTRVFGSRTNTLVAGACITLFVLALGITLRMEEPRIRVRWANDVARDKLAEVELQHGLVDRQAVENEWSYRLVDRSADTVARIFDNRLVVSVEGMDRERGVPPPRWEVGWREIPEWAEALQWPSIVAVALAMLLVTASFLTSRFARVIAAAACVIAVMVAGLIVRLPDRVRMGDLETYTATRGNFDMFMGSQSVRFEAHLSSALLRLIDRRLGATSESPAEAFRVLAQLATVWHSAMLLVAAWVGGWSPASLRYVALCVAAPAALMYFGFRELGYLSLNPAVFPLILAGLAGARWRFEAGCALAGIGAALHGFGLLTLIGAACAALSYRVPVTERLRFVGTAWAIGTSTYLIWIFGYLVVMGVGVQPGHAGAIPWRPLFANSLIEHRVSHAVLSVRGAAEVFAACWIAGVPIAALLPVAARRGVQVAPALAFAVPSIVFLVAFWPVQGLAAEGDLLFGAFPAVYALSWTAAQWSTATWMSLALMTSGHVVFWRVMFGDLFVNSRVY
jgi:hypothetical protein